MAQTKGQRSVGAKKAAITRKRNAKLKAEEMALKKRSVKKTARRKTAKKRITKKISTKSKGKRR